MISPLVSRWITPTLVLTLAYPVLALPKADQDGAAKIEGTANTDPVEPVDPDKAILSTILYPEGMVAGVFAREPDVMNATAISMDEQNRLFVAETHRFDRGIEDNRRNWHWLRDEVALKTVEDRLKLYEKWADKKEPGYYTKYAEKIRVLEDKDGDGKAEKSWLYADGFNDPLDGTAAGILAANGKVYFACIPHVWMLQDKDGDGVSDVRTSLQDGYGISVSLSGHDLNGFAFGPDGRIYFTIGDRGYDLHTADGRHLYDQYGGAIFRMEPDGSGLEVVHYNLRNPKEIAFDQYGVAFSVDNNADMGDKARVVQMVEGAMSGWNRGNQSFRNWPHAIDVTSRHDTPWMAELWWEIEAENRPNALLPPAGHLSVGPSGLAYNPGTGLAEKWDDRFFVCDYRGGQSEVISFEMEPNGAGFRIAESETFIKGFLNTDIEFGYDGKVYVSDFTGGWKTYEFGTVFVFHDPKETSKPVVKEVRSLFADGFDQRSADELAGLLKHQDMRVRQRAQFALAEDASNRGRFVAATETGNSMVTRLHGVWGLGQLARLKADAESVEALVKLASDDQWRVRGQVAQALGDAKAQAGRDALSSLLGDANANTRMLAAIALGKLGHREDVAKLVKMLEANKDGDPYLRHGAVHGMRLIAEANKTAEDILSFKDHPSREVRLGLIIALRWLGDAGIEYFLADKDPALVIETIQAINDSYIEGARPALAAATHLIGKSTKAIDYRIINAIMRIGKPEGALSLLALAEDDAVPEQTRVEALFQLGRWEKPPGADPTTGKVRPITGDRNLDGVRSKIADGLKRLFRNAVGLVLAEALKTGEIFDVAPAPETLRQQFLSDDNLRDIRLAALKSMRKHAGDELVPTLGQSVRSKDPEVRKASLKALAEVAPEVALGEVKRMLAGKDVFDQQVALAELAKLKGPEAAKVAMEMLLGVAELPLAIQLDVIEAAAKRPEPEVRKALEDYRSRIPQDDPLAAFQLTLEGGDAGKGRQVFYNHGAAQCSRCHKALPNRNGGVAGPDLRSIGKAHDAAYILESIIEPGARIASGYGMVSLTMKDGNVVAGLLLEDADDFVALADPVDASRKEYPRKDVASVSSPVSTMPPMAQILSKKEVRDLIAFLGSMKN
ncbi:dehydrogenase domain containing protein [Haloferula helveola]|uniref:Dehydrogenase domain containing protein n=1 Tax=Haloferula helveola TaxID=490095 RepID=A0ABN6GYD4_9BACT|nr:dehydrogenase domain containing protein [Haloferula helveola]